MQLLMPSLAMLLIGVAVTFFILPNFAPIILVAGGAAVMVIAMYINWYQFGAMEYERATWMYNLRKYSSYVLIAGILLGAYGFYAMNKVGEAAPMSIVAPMASPALPAMTLPTVGGGMRSMMDTASSRIQELLRKGRISLD